MQLQLISGYTKEQMVLHFFENHKIGQYSSYFITNYIYNTFELPRRKTLEQLSREVCATLSNFIYGNSSNKPNMNRTGIRHFFLYNYSGTQINPLPKIKYVQKNKEEKQLNLKPTQQSFKEEKPIQTSFDYDQEEINNQEKEIQETMGEEITPPLIQDIKNADALHKTENIKNAETLNNIQDPLQYLMEEIEKMNLPNLNQIILKQTINNREITITIS